MDCRVHESDNMSYFSFIILELETSLLVSIHQMWLSSPTPAHRGSDAETLKPLQSCFFPQIEENGVSYISVYINTCFLG